MWKPILTAAVILAASSAGAQDFSVALMAPWDESKVPDGQQCRLFGGDGATPPMQISGLPEGTATVRVQFNDKSYPPLADNGGHGVIGFVAHAGDITLPAVPGMTTDLPGGARVISAARSTGRYASVGYLPPCSGGRGNRYMADVIVLDAAGAELGRSSVELGRY